MIRIDAGVTLTELARRLGVSPAYLSRVEHGHDAAPTPDRVVAIARALEISPLVLLEIAQGAGAALASYLERVPEASGLFLEMARRDFGAAELARIRAYIDRELPGRDADARHARLGDVLEADRVLVQVVAEDLEDVVGIAATRLATDRGIAKTLVKKILEREAESPTLLGGGVAAPHAIVPGVRAAGAVLALAKPLRMRTPDGIPIRVVVVLVAPTPGKRQVQMLTHVARLALRGLATLLTDVKTSEKALARIETLDVS